MKQVPRVPKKKCTALEEWSPEGRMGKNAKLSSNVEPPARRTVTEQQGLA